MQVLKELLTKLATDPSYPAAPEDIELDDLKLVARALLPAEIMVGSKLKYELMQYEIME